MTLRKPLLYLIAFISGAVVLALEIVAGRYLQPTFGNTVQVWGIVIGIFLSGLSVGYYAGGHIADRLASFKAFSLLLLVSSLLLLVLPFIAGTVCDFVFDKLPLEKVETRGPLYTSLILFFLPTVTLGMVSPFAVRLLSDDPARLGRQVGTLYAVSTLGSILGALGTTFVLVDRLGSKDAFFFLAGTQFALVLCAFVASFRDGRSSPLTDA